jgi:hypothetical protein
MDIGWYSILFTYKSMAECYTDWENGEIDNLSIFD